MVWHKTQGSSYAGAWGAYRQARIAPHFTLDTNGVLYQHFDTNVASWSLRGWSGGETNRASAIQVEVVGFSGETATPAQLRTMRRLIEWCERHHGVPRHWPAGRPPLNANTGYGANTPHRMSHTWRTQGGHYGHSQVPGNTHWDPAWTYAEWSLFASAAKPAAPVTPNSPQEEEDVKYELVRREGTTYAESVCLKWGPFKTSPFLSRGLSSAQALKRIDEWKFALGQSRVTELAPFVYDELVVI